MFLFTGLTGAVGTEILNIIDEFDIKARGLIRRPENASLLEDKGVEVVIGDMSDSTALNTACQGIENAFLLMANCPQQLALEKHFTDTAKDQGVGCLVKMSANAVALDSPALFKTMHAESEAYIAESGLKYTHIRPNFFMQNMLHVAQTIKDKDKFFMPMGDGKVGLIDIKDVARFVLTIMTTAGHDGRTYEVTGTELLSFYDLAEQLSTALGRTIEYIDLPLDAYKESMRQFVPDEWYVKNVAELFQQIANNSGATVNRCYADIVGCEPDNFRCFMQRHAAVFSP